MPAKPVSSAAGTSGLGKRPEADGERKEREQQRYLDGEQGAQNGEIARAQGGGDQARQRDHQNEFWQRKYFPDDAVRAQYQGRAERDEVAGYMRGEQALQAEEAGGVDKAAIEREQGGNRRRSVEFSHGLSLICR